MNGPNTLGGLLERRTERDAEIEGTCDALFAPGEPERRYDAARLLTDARKTGNFLRQLGVGPGRTVAVADAFVPESVLSLFGAALLGAPVRFVSTDTRTANGSNGSALAAGARVLVGPVEAIERTAMDVAERIAYGGTPESPDVSYFERDVWSENPTFPPGGPESSAAAIEAKGGLYTHRELCEATERVVDHQGFEAGVTVAVRAPLADPRTVVAGVLAPLACGGTVLFPDAGIDGDLAVISSSVERENPEPTVLNVADVEIGSE